MDDILPSDVQQVNSRKRQRDNKKEIHIVTYSTVNGRVVHNHERTGKDHYEVLTEIGGRIIAVTSHNDFIYWTIEK